MKIFRLYFLAFAYGSALLTSSCLFEQVEKSYIPADNPYAAPMPKLEPLKVPLETVFRGRKIYENILAQASEENWRTLPLGERLVHVALELRKASYQPSSSPAQNDGMEMPAVDFQRMDEREFIDAALAVARQLNAREVTGEAEHLLRLVQLARYRNGLCDGTAHSRLKIWDEIFHDSEKRGLLFNVTRQIGGVRAQRSHAKLPQETHLDDEHGDAEDHVRLMEDGHKEVIAEQKEKWLEAHNHDLPLFYLKQEQLAKAEPYIQNGDLMALVSECGEAIEEVGIAVKGSDGRPRVLHMSKAAGHAMVDLPLTEYMAKNAYAGVMVARPLEAPAF